MPRSAERPRPVFLVTGASAGIGRAIATALAARRGAVALLGRDEHELGMTADRVRTAGAIPYPLVADVRSEADVAAAVDTVASNAGGIDHVINNAGIAIVEPLEASTTKAWEQVLATNLTAPFLLARYALPHLRLSAQASIVNVSSVMARVGMSGLVSYCATKGGLESMARQMALELAPDGIRVNCVVPGFVETDMYRTHHTDERKRQIAARHAVGRVGQPDEIAAAVTFLTSDDASFVTGASIVVDGGLLTQVGL